MYRISGRCSHVMGLVYLLDGWKSAGLNEVPQLPSCTSVPQQWGRPCGPKIEAEPVAAISFASSDKLIRKRRAVQPLLQDNRYYYFSESSSTMVKYGAVYIFLWTTLSTNQWSLMTGNYINPVICLLRQTKQQEEPNLIQPNARQNL